MEQALQVLGTKKSETLMVGDNYDTDILAGMNAGMDTLLVHTGVTTKELLSSYEKQPTFVTAAFVYKPFDRRMDDTILPFPEGEFTITGRGNSPL